MSFLRSFLGKQAEQEEAIPASLQAGTRDLVDRVAPSALLVGHDCVAMQGAAEPGKERALMRHWWVEDLPPALSFESLDPILQFPGRVCTSMLVNPVSAREALQALRQERTGQVSSLVIKQKQGRLAEPETAANLESLTAEMSDLQIARRLPLQLNWVIGLSAHDEEELEDLSRKMSELLTTADLTFHEATLRQEAALKSLLPTGINFLGDQRNVNANTLACLFPFSRRMHYDPEGVPYGIERNSGAWVMFNDWACDNQNMLVLGEMGSGKSVFLKWKTLWHVLMGGRAFVIDLEGEFEPLARILGAEHIDMGLTSEERLNVLDINPDDDEGYYSGAMDLLGWLAMAIGGMTPHERNAVTDAYRRVMGEAGVVREDRSTWRKGPSQMPTLEDLYGALMVEEHAAARDVAARVKEFAVGMYSDAFNSRTTIDPHSPLVVFDVSGVRNEAFKGLRMRQIVTFIWSRMLRGDVPTLVVADEAWHWLKHPEAASELEGMARRFRKRYGGLQLATQHIDDLDRTGSAQVIRDTADIAVLFRQRGTAVPAVARLFGLNELEARELRTLSAGDALLVTPDDRIPLYVAVPPDLLDVFSTKPQDRLGEAQPVMDRVAAAAGEPA